MDRKKVVGILTAHDALKAHERADFAAYIDKIFAAAEKVQVLEKRVAELEAAAK
jgi:hypothetical protein